jgi:hypothetical protein
MYQAMDFFLEHAGEIEEVVFHQVAKLFNLGKVGKARDIPEDQRFSGKGIPLKPPRQSS